MRRMGLRGREGREGAFPRKLMDLPETFKQGAEEELSI